MREEGGGDPVGGWLVVRVRSLCMCCTTWQSSSSSSSPFCLFGVLTFYQKGFFSQSSPFSLFLRRSWIVYNKDLFLSVMSAFLHLCISFLLPTRGFPGSYGGEAPRCPAVCFDAGQPHVSLSLSSLCPFLAPPTHSRCTYTSTTSTANAHSARRDPPEQTTSSLRLRGVCLCLSILQFLFSLPSQRVLGLSQRSRRESLHAVLC